MVDSRPVSDGQAPGAGWMGLVGQEGRAIRCGGGWGWWGGRAGLSGAVVDEVAAEDDGARGVQQGQVGARVGVVDHCVG
jgi:hypothetical protein